MANLIEIIIGTYEEFLLGYRVANTKNEERVVLGQSFATRSHTGSVRCLAVNKSYLASGGADDRIFIYDMKSRKEIQTLMHHEGTVNALAITPDGSHLLTGSDDGKMTAIRIGSWQIDAVWKKAHANSPVTHISCHPSSKLALTLGNDLTLRTWNLVKGRLAYTTNLKSKTTLGRNPDCICWSADGDHFTIAGLHVLEIWSSKTAGVVKEINFDSKPVSLCWLNSIKIAVGLENGKIIIVDINSDDKPEAHEAHKQRVKGIAFVNNILASASSSGEICLWTVDFEANSITQVASTNIGCRPTCIALLDLTQFNDEFILKLKKEQVEEEVVTKKLKTKPTKCVQSIGNVIVETEENHSSLDDDSYAQVEEKVSKKKTKKNKQENAPNVEIVTTKKNKKRKHIAAPIFVNGFQEESASNQTGNLESKIFRKKQKVYKDKDSQIIRSEEKQMTEKRNKKKFKHKNV